MEDVFKYAECPPKLAFHSNFYCFATGELGRPVQSGFIHQFFKHKDASTQGIKILIFLSRRCICFHNVDFQGH